jgi:hypothetical protein
VYAFENWKMGELVEGPVYEKYFVTCTFMWPYKKMPNPRGGEHLINYNCEVLYKKSSLEFPIKPKSPDDFKPNTKLAKKKSVPIWLVTITIPKKLMADIQRGSIELENEKLDLDDMADAYEEGADEENANEGNEDMQPSQDIDGSQMGGGMPQAPQMPQMQQPGMM